MIDRVVLGTWSIGGWFWGEPDLDASRAALRAWIDAGQRWVDTAPLYGFGLSEAIVGEFAHHLSVATKVGLRWAAPDPQPGTDPEVRRDLRPESVVWECEQSLRRLGVDRIDLLQCHWPDDATPVEDTMAALLQLRERGDIDRIGVSNFPVPLLQRAQQALPDGLFSTQPRFNALDRSAATAVLPWCAQHQVRALVYSPLEHGLLTGAIGGDRRFPEADRRSRHPGFSEARRARVQAALGALEPLAAEHGTTVAGVVLAWTLEQPGVTSCIVGARNAEQATRNAQVERLRLRKDEVQTVADALAEPLGAH